MTEDRFNGELEDVGTLCYEGHDNLYLNITNRCSASCVFCIRDVSDGVYGYDLRLKKEPSLEDMLEKLSTLDLESTGRSFSQGLGKQHSVLIFFLRSLTGLRKGVSGQGLIRMDMHNYFILTGMLWQN